MAKIRNGDSYLEKHLSANDYYSEGESVAGVWVGRGAKFLGIEGNEITSKDESFERLRMNAHPLTGEKLTKRNKTTRKPTFDEARKSLCQKLRVKGQLKDGVLPSLEEVEVHRSKMKPICNRVAFFDFQCGCAKSVSVMALVGGDERLRVAHEKAVMVALGELESFTARRVSIGKAKHHSFTENLCAAIFQHDASRALDPQLHTHCVVANATFDEGKKEWVALTEFEMVKAIRYAGKVYQNDLAKRVQTLGYGIIERRSEKGLIEGFEIAGIAPELLKRFSKRRAAVEEEIEGFKARVGRLPSPAEIAVLTRESRESKSLEKISTTEVRAKQVAQLSPEEVHLLDELKVAAQMKVGECATDQEEVALEGAMKHVFERETALPTHAVLAEALNQQLGKVDVEKLKKLYEEKVTQPKQSLALYSPHLVVLLSDSNSLASLCTSSEHLEREAWAVKFVNESVDKHIKMVKEEPVTSSWLAKEQEEAVKFICSSRDGVCAIRGIAGAGKTTMLKELHTHLSKDGEVGYPLLYLAPTASAVDVLKSEGFVNATTVSEYLVKIEQEPWYHAFIIVDEAGLQSTKQGYEVLKLAQKNWQRIVLVGDSKQHVSVEAGDFLRLLETHSAMKSYSLTQIRRQGLDEYREAVALMAEGRAGDALESFNSLGWINEGGSNYIENAAQNYLIVSENGAKADQVIAVAPTWDENFALTDGIRKGLKESKVLAEGVSMEVVHSLQWTKWQRSQSSNYKEGYLVTTCKNLGRKEDSLKKGIAYVVQKVVDDVVYLEATSNRHSSEGMSSGIKRLPLYKSQFFDVAEKRNIEVAIGDKLLLRANNKSCGIINGSVVTVAGIEDGVISTREGVTIPSTYRQLTHGYVVTSHKSQGRTADHVIVAAAKLDEKAAYVATSRGRVSCDIHTPETEKLIEGARRSSLRLGALDATMLVPSQGDKEPRNDIHHEVGYKFADGMEDVDFLSKSRFASSQGSLSRSPRSLRVVHPLARQRQRVRAIGAMVMAKLPQAMKRMMFSASIKINEW